MNNTVMFNYNQEQASQTGGGQWVIKSGGFDLKVVRALFTHSQTTNSKAGFLEIDVEARDGSKCNYISVCHTKGDGTVNDYGQNTIQSLMGCCGVQALSRDQAGNCPELLGKAFKGILQRVDYTKNNGQDGFKFDLKLCANLKTGQTIKENSEQLQAKSFAEYAESVVDKDDRKKSPQNSAGGTNQPQQQGFNEPSSDFDDDIPFR